MGPFTLIAYLVILRLRMVDCNETDEVPPRNGCSFSSEDWCGYRNVFDETRPGPKWFHQKAPAESNAGHRYYGQYNQPNNRLTLHGSHPMEWPPKGDFYLYTGPTQENQLADKFAEVQSPTIVVNDSSKCLYFSYHNRIPLTLTPTLVVKIRVGNTSAEEDDVVLAEFYSVESSKWFETQVPLPTGEYSLVFAGRNYNSKAVSGGQVAITNIAIADGNCTRTVADWLLNPGDCGFEDDDLCGYIYRNDSSVRLLGLFAEALSSTEQNQRQQNQRPPNDRFLAMTQTFYEIANHGNKARLESPEISIEREGCISLWYYNSVQSETDETNALNIFQTDATSEQLLFRLPIPKTNRDRWHQLNGALPRGIYHLILEVVYTNDYAENDYVAFDSIEIFNKSCSHVKSLASVCDSQIPKGHSLCMNQGSCVSIGKKFFRCVCNNGFYGRRCEHRYLCNEPSNQCQNGGTCVDDGKVDFVCNCQSGYDGKLCHQLKTCEQAYKTFKYARPITSSSVEANFGSTIQFECMDGLAKFGELRATCTEQGVWNMQGRCLHINCGPPPNFHLTTIIHVTNTTLHGQAKYRCGEGLTTYPKQDILICKNQYNIYNNHWSNFRDGDTISGMWLLLDGNSRISCHEIPGCGVPGVIANTTVTVTSTMMGGVAVYRCNSGYLMNTNLSVGEMRCSEHGQWRNEAGIVLECWMLPDCGPPPQISFGRVNFTNTSVGSKAFYGCLNGYRLIGERSAICWKVRSDRRQKWVDWLFVPECELSCPVKIGRSGNISLAKFKVSSCTLSGDKSYSPRLHCEPSVTYVMKSAQLRNEMVNRNAERVVFYGSDLCISEKVTRVRRYVYDDSVVYNVTKCRSFCLQFPFDIHDVVVYEEVTYLRKADIGDQYDSRGYFITRTGEPGTKRQQTIMRYVHDNDVTSSV